jgi:hypothetical protein
MSYEYYIQAHIDQDGQEIPTVQVLSIFEPFIIEKEDSYIELQFAEDEKCTIYLDTNSTTISHFMVSRPCGSKQLGECLYQVMLLGNFVFFEPDGKRPILVNSATEAHLPTDMMEVLGKPLVAKNLEDFLELYFNNR